MASNRPLTANTTPSSYSRATLGVITNTLGSTGPYTIFGDGVIWDETLQKAIPPEKTSYADYFVTPLGQYPGGVG
jgi:hypothetical protein